MTIETEEYKRIIDDVKRKEYNRGYEEGVANKRTEEYNRGYDDGVKDVFCTIRRVFSANLNDIFDKHEDDRK